MRANVIRCIAGLLFTAGLAEAVPPSFVAAGLCVQPTRWDTDGNVRLIEQWARLAIEKGASVVVTPEGFLDGYAAKLAKRTPGLGAEKAGPAAKPPVTREQFRQAAEPLDGPALTRLSTLARELKIHLSVGFSEQRDEAVFNAVVIFSPAGRPILRYAKTHNAANHEIYTTLGDSFPVVDTPLGRWGALICYDRQLPETARILSLKGARFIIVPSFGGYAEINDAMMRTRAYENSVWLMFVHPRRGLVIDPGGNVVAASTGSSDQLVIATITPITPPDDAPIRQRRPEIYRELAEPNPG